MIDLTKQDFRNKMANGFTYIVVPSSMREVPLQMSDFRKWDEDGNPIDGEFSSIADIEVALGAKFVNVIEGLLEGDHIAIRWSFRGRDAQNERALFVQELVDAGLVSLWGDAYDIDDVDWSNVPANGFIVVERLEMHSVPRAGVKGEIS